MPAENIDVEARSTTTQENIAFSAQAFGLKPGTPVVLVTSALNMPRALAAMWTATKDEKATPGEIYSTLLAMDAVLGFGFAAMQEEALAVDAGQIQKLLDDRTAARKAKDFARADAIRRHLDEMGIEIMDSPAGTTWRKK